MDSHWQKIKQDNPAIHASLQLVAAQIYVSKSLSIELPDLSQITEAIDTKLLFLQEDKVSFVDLEICQDYISHYAAELLEKAWLNLEEFLTIHENIERFGISLSEFYLLENKALIILSNEYQRNIAEQVVKASALKHSEKHKWTFRRLYDSFWEIINEIEVESIIIVLDVMGDEFALGSSSIYKGIEQFCTKDITKAETFHKMLMQRANLSIASLIFYVLRGMARIDFPEAHRKAILLSEMPEPILRRVGIWVLGDFDYTNDQSGRLLNSTLERLQILRENPDPETDSYVVRCYEGLLKHTKEVQEILCEFVLCSNPAIWKTMISVLWMQAGKTHNEEWYKESILNLLKNQTFTLEELSTLDHCIDRYIKDDPHFAINLLVKIATRWDFKVNGGFRNLVESLHQTIIQLSNSQLDILKLFFTQWIASNNYYLHHLAFEINYYFNHIPVMVNDRLEKSNKPTLTLSKQALDTYDEDTICNLMCRIVGHVIIDAESMCALLLSALQQEPTSQKVVKFIKDLLVRYVLYNYPSEAGEYLKEKAEQADLTIIECSVIQEVLAESNYYFEERQKLPRLKELQPPSQRTYLLRLAKWKQQKVIMQDAEKKPVFTQILPPVVFLYGRSVLIERDNGDTELMPFISFSASCEIPQGELIDPIGQEYLRMNWRLVGMVEENDENISVEEENL